jgi:hypothetical protein
MPKLSALFVRMALVHLWLGISFGALLLANKGFPFAPWVWTLLPAHMEILLLGWLVQFGMGIAFWILPRFSNGAARGDERWSQAALVLLNLGILMSIAPGFLSLPGLAVLGRCAEFLAVLTFVIGNWRRVKASGV